MFRLGFLAFLNGERHALTIETLPRRSTSKVQESRCQISVTGNDIQGLVRGDTGASDAQGNVDIGF